MSLDLTEEETDALATLRRRTIDDDRYPLCPRIQLLKGILGKIRSEPVREPLPPQVIKTGSERLSLLVIGKFDGNDERIFCLIVHEPRGIIAVASEPFPHLCQVAGKISVSDPNHDSAHSANPLVISNCA